MPAVSRKARCLPSWRPERSFRQTPGRCLSSWREQRQQRQRETEWGAVSARDASDGCPADSALRPAVCVLPCGCRQRYVIQPECTIEWGCASRKPCRAKGRRPGREPYFRPMNRPPPDRPPPCFCRLAFRAGRLPSRTTKVAACGSCRERRLSNGSWLKSRSEESSKVNKNPSCPRGSSDRSRPESRLRRPKRQNGCLVKTAGYPIAGN